MLSNLLLWKPHTGIHQLTSQKPIYHSIKQLNSLVLKTFQTKEYAQPITKYNCIVQSKLGVKKPGFPWFSMVTIQQL
jgi:hypothetical protein